MRMIQGGMLAFSALITFGAIDLPAQNPADARPGRGFRGGPDVESIMFMHDRLELTEAQLSSLEALRRETVQRRNSERSEMEEMSSQLRAGQIRRSEMMAFMEDRRDAATALAADRRARLEAILSEAQLETIAATRSRSRVGRNARPGARNRPNMRRGQRRSGGAGSGPGWVGSR